jgi:AraC-like DNA-binding protein
MRTGGQQDEQWEAVGRQADFNPAKMALLCAISDRHLQRIFRTHFKCTPGKWLRELQCRLARGLIAQGYSTKAAAAELKFSTEAHFCREFKKIYGTPPQSFAPNDSNYSRLVRLGRNPALEDSSEHSTNSL